MPTPTKPLSGTTQPSRTNVPAALAPPRLPFASFLAELELNATQPTAPSPALPLPQAPNKPTSNSIVLPVARATDDRKPRGASDGDLDPMARQTAQLAPPPVVQTDATQQAALATPEARARLSLEELVPQLVKKIAWSGDARAGTVRMELGAGDLAGSTLIVSSESGRISVSVRAPAGTDTAAWSARLATRLQERGLAVDSIDVS